MVIKAEEGSMYEAVFAGMHMLTVCPAGLSQGHAGDGHVGSSGE